MEHILLPENGYIFAARIRCLCVNCIYFQKAATFSYPFYGYNFVAAFASKISKKIKFARKKNKSGTRFASRKWI